MSHLYWIHGVLYNTKNIKTGKDWLRQINLYNDKTIADFTIYGHNESHRSTKWKSLRGGYLWYLWKSLNQLHTYASLIFDKMERITKKNVHFQQMSAKDHNAHQLDSRQLRCCIEPARTKKMFIHNWFVVSGRPSSYECTWEESHNALTYSSATLVSWVLSNFPSAPKARRTHSKTNPNLEPNCFTRLPSFSQNLPGVYHVCAEPPRTFQGISCQAHLFWADRQAFR